MLRENCPRVSKKSYIVFNFLMTHSLHFLDETFVYFLTHVCNVHVKIPLLRSMFIFGNFLPRRFKSNVTIIFYNCIYFWQKYLMNHRIGPRMFTLGPEPLWRRVSATHKSWMLCCCTPSCPGRSETCTGRTGPEETWSSSSEPASRKRKAKLQLQNYNYKITITKLQLKN
jgi:hypothetical protein